MSSRFFACTTALGVLASSLFGSGDARAAVAPRPPEGYAAVDSLAPGPRVFPRYILPPTFAGYGTGSMEYPGFVGAAYDHASDSSRIPVETWTVTATSATSWQVVGSVSGAQATATTGTPYTTDDGTLSFRIDAGGVPFAASDAFTFSVAASVDASSLPGARPYVLGNDDSVPIIYDLNNPWDFPVVFAGETFGSSGDSTLLVHDNGYLQLFRDSDPWRFPLTAANNEPLPSRKIYPGSNNESPATIAPFWDALRPKPSSRLWVASLWQTTGSLLFIQWTDFAHESDPTASYTFQVVMHEQDRLRFHYLTMQNGSGTAADGSSASIGVQPDLMNAYDALAYSFDQAVVTSGLAIELGRDADQDWLPEGVEQQYGTLDSDATTDNGTPALSDGAQIQAGLDPTAGGDNAGAQTDTDTDTLPDVEEIFLHLDETSADTDMDGVEDGDEIQHDTDPGRPDTDGDGVVDGDEDLDADGTLDSGETDPLDFDSDDDGVGDGLEGETNTDARDAAKARLTAAIAHSIGSARHIAMAVDSDGNAHVAIYSRDNNVDRISNDVYVMLLKPDGSGGFTTAVAPTVVSAHSIEDDRYPAIMTAPGSGVVDRTFLFTTGRAGRAYLTELDFNADDLDGDAAEPAAIAVSARHIALPFALQHPSARIDASGNIHVVTGGKWVSPAYEPNSSGSFINSRATNGVYYLRLSTAGELTVPPVEVYRRDPPNHFATHPLFDLDAAGNVHGVFRAGWCGFSRPASHCELYYFKVAASGALLMPATQLDLDGVGGMHKSPAVAVSPNGNVNIVYSSIAPAIPPNNCGGYCFGRPLFLHVVNTANNAVNVVVSQKELLSPRAPASYGSGTFSMVSYREPGLAVDAGGNLHVQVAEDNASGTHGMYWIFTPQGELEAGPVDYPMDYRGYRPVVVRGTRAYLAYSNPSNQPTFRSFDFTGLVDLSGAGQVTPPSVPLALTSIAPAVGPVDQSVAVLLAGSNFGAGSTVTIGGVALTEVVVWSPTQMSALVPAGSLAEGAHDVVVTRPDGASATLAGGYRAGFPAPTVTAVYPASVPVGVATPVAAVGSGFRPGATVTVGGAAAGAVSVASSGSVQLEAPATLAVGAHDVVVTNPDGQAATLAGGVTVAAAPAPSISSVVPSVLPNDADSQSVVLGASFVDGAIVTVGGDAVPTTFMSNSSLRIEVAAGREPGSYDVVVTNPGGGSATASGALTVVSPVGREPTVIDAGSSGCGCAGGSQGGNGVVMLAALALAMGLSRARRGAERSSSMKASPGVIAVLVLAVFAAAGGAHAAVGPRDDALGYGSADSLAPGAKIVPRYALPATRTGTGNGTMTQPSLSPAVMNPATGVARVPVETWTAARDAATNVFTVTGSLSGVQTNKATPGAAYTTDNGLIAFTIVNGSTAFVAGDTFTFSVVDYVDVGALPAAQRAELPILDGQKLLLNTVQLPFWTFQVLVGGVSYGNSTAHYLGVTDNGYLELFSLWSSNQPFVSPPSVSANEPLPSRTLWNGNTQGTPSPPVAPFWDDLLPKASSRIRVGSIDAAGTRALVIEWKDFAHHDDPTASYTFEVVLFEGRDGMRFHYETMTNGTGPLADGRSATIGTQPSLSNSYSAIQYGFNQSVVSNGLAIEITRDADGDRLPVGVELAYGTNESDPTSDSGLDQPSDGAQLLAGLNPTVAGDNPTTDTDGDSLIDVEETFAGLDPMDEDSDADGLDDDVELSLGTSPLIPDSDEDGLVDGDEDTNGDGVVGASETNPRQWDSDGDGLSDGFEVNDGKDPRDPESTRFGGPLRACFGSCYNPASVVDSHGNLHVAAYDRSSRRVVVSLFVPSASGGLEVAVAPTELPVAQDRDHRFATLVTLPRPDAIVDRTIVFFHTERGHFFMAELDFELTTLSGAPAEDDGFVVRERLIGLPHRPQHPTAAAAPDGTIHVSYLGVYRPIDDSSYNDNDYGAPKGGYHLRLSADGTILSGPTELWYKEPPHTHSHVHPRLAVDAGGNVHGLFRRGACSWNDAVGPRGCSMYYYKVGPGGELAIPATRLALDGDGGIDKAPSLTVGPNGNVYVVYASIAPLVSATNCGGYCYGRPIRVHAFSTVNGQIEPLLNQQELVSVAPPAAGHVAGFAGSIAVWHKPAVDVDDAGNLHVLSTEDMNDEHAYYWIFSPQGQRLAGPFTLDNGDMWGIRSISVRGAKAYMSYYDDNGGGSVATFDFAGLVDLSSPGEIPPPASEPVRLDEVSPGSLAVGTTGVVSLFGGNFNANTLLRIGALQIDQRTVWSTSQMSAIVDTAGLAEGSYDVVVTNPDGSMDLLEGGFHVGYPAPVVGAVVPPDVPAGVETTVIVTGSNFRDPVSLRVGGLDVGQAQLVSAEAVQVTLPPTLEPGTYSVTAINPDGQTGMRDAALSVGGAGVAPSITAVLPSAIPAGVESYVDVVGRHFQPGLSVAVGGQPALTTSLVSGEHVRISVDRNRAIGTYDLTVVNPDGTSTTLQGALSVVESELSPRFVVKEGGCAAAAPALGLLGAALAALAALRRRRR